jgi:hypothetical protein
MKSVVFNIHDVVLLLLAAECAMLAIFLLVHRRVTISPLLLAMFAFLNGMIALDTLIFWGAEVRRQMFDAFPDMFFLLGLGVFFEGPVLYWFTRSMLGRDFSFRLPDTLHLLPAIAAPAYLYFVYYSQPEDIQRALVLDFQIFQVPFYHVFVTAQKIIVIIYGMASLLRLRKHAMTLKDNYVNDGADFAWLRLLIVCFLLAWLWNFLAHLAGMYAGGGLSDLMGILGNYLVLVLINVLLFYILVHPEVLARLWGGSGEWRRSRPTLK